MSLLTNDEVLEVNQRSSGNRLVYSNDAHVVWRAEAGDGSTYAALFNLGDKPSAVSVSLEQLGLTSPKQARDLWKRSELGAFSHTFETTLPAHGSMLIKLYQS